MATYQQLGRTASLTITNQVTGRSVNVKTLRVVFKIKKLPEQDGNKAKIEIYNLSPESRELINSARSDKGDPQTHVELRVGYRESTEGIIFRGRCEVMSTFKPPNWVTVLLGEDGTAQFKYVFEKTFSKGTPIFNIVKEIAETSGIEKFRLLPMTDLLKKTRTFSGPPLKIIKSLQKTYGFTFDIQDEGVIIRSNKYGLDPRYLIKMDASSGLLGEPRTRGDLVVIDTLINPDIRPNSYINLVSRSADLNGIYIIQKVDSTGDSYSGAWTMTVELLPTSTPEKISTKEG